MDDGIVNHLINTWGNSVKDSYTPFIQQERDRFLPQSPKQAGPLESLVLSPALLGGSSGVTNTFTGNSAFPQDMWQNRHEDQIDTIVHENYHSRRSDLPLSSKLALNEANNQLFGGSNQYQSFLKDVSSAIGIPKSSIYTLQQSVPVVGKLRQEEEILAHLVGAISSRNDKDTFKGAITKLHPKGWEWFDMNTRHMDFLRDK